MTVLHGHLHALPVEDYDLSATLQSGQAFRWTPSSTRPGTWEGVIGQHWVRLGQVPGRIVAETAGPTPDVRWLKHYLQTDIHLPDVLRTFPEDAPLQASVQACRGLRLLRQDPWECLASFLLSSCKQIVQIRQIVALLCQRYGSPVPTPPGSAPAHAFPTPRQLAACSESALRECKMGWRASALLKVAQCVASGDLDLEQLRGLTCAHARETLVALPGVGPKIANCVLLFAYGFPEAFPVDVWVAKAIRQLYFPRRKPTPARLRRFLATHFGPNAGYAQQYLFHYMRTQPGPGPVRVVPTPLALP